jgi:uncharacterized protein
MIIKKVKENKLLQLEENDLAELEVIEAGKTSLWLDIGGGKRIPLPTTKVRGNVKPGDSVVVGIYIDKKGYFTATMALSSIIENRGVPAEGIKRGDQIIGEVYNVTEDGTFVLTPEGYVGFIHESELTVNLKAGAKVSARVTFVREDGRLNLSIRPLKEIGRVVDAEVILEYIKKRDGEMPYSDESSAEIIKEKFNISKNAFKRALGYLMKEGKIYQDKGWTYIKKGEV